jgi:hypothetical protein
MRTIEDSQELERKVLYGLKLAYKKLIEFKKAKNSVLVMVRDGKIVKVKPE